MQASFPLRKRRCVSCALPRAHDWRNEAGPHVLLLHRMSTPLGAMHHARPHAMTAQGAKMARSRATIVHPSRYGALEFGLGYILYPIQPRTGETQTPEFARINPHY